MVKGEPPSARSLSPAMKRVLAAEAAYRASRKDWKHTDPAFTSHVARFQVKVAAPGDYHVNTDTMGELARAGGDAKKVHPSAWASNKAPHHADPALKHVDRIYDKPTNTFELPKHKRRQSPAFASATPRDSDVALAAASNTPRREPASRQPSLTTGGGDAASSAKGGASRSSSPNAAARGLPTMRSNCPRFPTYKPATTATYDTSAHNTMGGQFAGEEAKRKARPSAWSRPPVRPVLGRAAAAQQPATGTGVPTSDDGGKEKVSPRTLADNDNTAQLVSRFGRAPAVSAPFQNRVQRFPERKADAPPPGSYTPDTWSAGPAVV